MDHQKRSLWLKRRRRVSEIIEVGTADDFVSRAYDFTGTAVAIHAGLECGLFCDRLEGLDAVSFGPQMQDIHTSRERLNIASVERTWNYLLAVLERL